MRPFIYFIIRYVEGFISALKNFMTKYEENGKNFFNEAVTQSELALSVSAFVSHADLMLTCSSR